MALVLLLTFVGVALSALMVPMVLTQLGSTRAVDRRAQSLNAAQTGLDIMLGQIRAATDATGAGQRTRLPCGPLTGRVGVGGTARYQVTVDYLGVDPQGQSDAWITANRIRCTAGSGTASTPGYALLRSQGTNDPTGAFNAVPSRFLRATYPLRMSNQNISGGLIHVYKTAVSNDLCLDAGSASPVAGTNVQMQLCSAANLRQRFAYNANLTIVLLASRTPAAPQGMCLDAGVTPHVLGRAVQVQPCSATTAVRQQWIFTADGNFEGTTNGRTTDGFCFNVQTRDTPGSFVILGSSARQTCRRPYDNIETFQPEASIGAGAAGAFPRQLVNVNEFGRCLTVTNQNLNFAYLIALACQQVSVPTSVTWDQQWNLPPIVAGATSATGTITSNSPGVPYCLRSPGSIAAGRYVTVAACPAGAAPQNMTWTVYIDTGVFTTSYRIIDGYGYCLSPTDPSAVPPDFHPVGQQVSKLVVATCSGATLQKWSAPPNFLQTLPVRDVSEK